MNNITSFVSNESERFVKLMENNLLENFYEKRNNNVSKSPPSENETLYMVMCVKTHSGRIEKTWIISFSCYPCKNRNKIKIQ